MVRGGIDLKERQALKSMEKNFNPKIVFAVLRRQYLSNKPLMIRDPGGNELFRAISKGPWVMNNLPPGSYEITAVYKKQKKKQTMTVGDKLNIVMFHWKPQIWHDNFHRNRLYKFEAETCIFKSHSL